ncbi:MAG: hypothetical protein IJ389_02915 [Clostridia bacterium]|nr:hypothetical protein [Oscillospiraceae bacterium]MBQ7836184.1 hypothetical protein [Clostridia bacterium]
MKAKKTDKKLRSAIATMVDIVAKEATAMKKEEERNLKQLKELTGAAKELATVIKTLDSDDEKDNASVINVIFGEEEKDWAI